MSDYVHTKAVMYPITKETLDKMNLKDAYDLEDRFPKTELGKLFVETAIDYKSSGDYSYYISLELVSTYGEDSADFGRSRFLIEKEQQKYVPLFRQIIPDLEPSKLKLVEFCYYNCCECQDYYIAEDDFYKEI